MTNRKDPVDSTIFLNKFSPNEEYEYSLDHKNCSWVKDILKELEGHICKEYSVKINTPGSCFTKFYIVKRNNDTLSEHVIIKGTIEINYDTPCVRCLEITHQTLKTSFSVCYLHESKEKDSEYDDIASIFCNEEEMDLYFYKKGRLNLKELINEHIYLSLNRFPLHDKNCKGLCPTCGINLNIEKCSH